jgi:hypothetical protein
MNDNIRWANSDDKTFKKSLVLMVNDGGKTQTLINNSKAAVH